jgi:putative chitinase
MPIHFSDLQRLYPTTRKDVLMATVDPLNHACDRFDISTGSRKAAFVSQLGHESAGFSVMMENLNYSADGLHRVFPKYFPSMDLANSYARKPQKIAARVYANRMGNGPESSGEGFTFRGRGYIQLTGKNNYVAFAHFMEMSLTDVIHFLETRDGAAMSAGWYWAMNGLNALADQGKFKTITQKINGGFNGLEDRVAHYELAKRLFD